MESWLVGVGAQLENLLLFICLCVNCLYTRYSRAMYKVGWAAGEEEQGGGGLRQVGDDEVVDGGGDGYGGVGDGYMVMVATSTAVE